MFFGPCMADETRIRLIAHLAGDLTRPYSRIHQRHRCHRRVSMRARAPSRIWTASAWSALYPRRVTIGKADDLLDGWRTLEKIRLLVNQVWARRPTIIPSFELRAQAVRTGDL